MVDEALALSVIAAPDATSSPGGALFSQSGRILQGQPQGGLTMHHSETPIPGTAPAVVLIIIAGAVLAAALIGGLYGLAQGFSWLAHIA
jgi:hypothetical protein